jgi:DNA polymerase III epsilon subunit-like protein
VPVWLSYDVESTGLDVNEDRIIEVGAILFSTAQKKCLESQGFLVKADKPISDEITKITGITQAAVDRFGYDSADALDTVIDMMNQADAIVGQNVIQFDKRITESWARREGKTLPEKLYVDTRTDLLLTQGKHLQYMCADNFFLNLFPHSALSDCQSVVKLLEKEDIDKVIERAKSPTVVLIAHHRREDNDKAKKMRFRWNPTLRVWWLTAKQLDVEKIASEAPFDISVSNEIAPETLWYDN